MLHSHRSRVAATLFLDTSSVFLSKSRFSFSSYSSSSTSPNKQPDVSPSPELFVHKYNFSNELASKVASASSHIRNPHNPELLLSYFKDKGFSQSQLERIARQTDLLSRCLERSVEPKLKIFQDLGFSQCEAAEVVGSDFHTMLCRRTDTIILALSVLKRLLGSNEHVMKVINKCKGLFYADPAKTLLPNIEFLKSCGVSAEQINRLLYTRFSQLFMGNPETIRKSVHKLDKMGVERTSKMFIYAVWAVSTMSDETWELKLKSFMDMGFSEDDISYIESIEEYTYCTECINAENKESKRGSS